ncbi:MAG: hypothetical protein RLN85_19745, partial [Pseudomonadales bacterium]
MDRRKLLTAAGAAMIAGPTMFTGAARADWKESGLNKAAASLKSWVDHGRVHGASLLVQQHSSSGAQSFSQNYGTAAGPEPVFLLASISKPMTAAA